MDAESHRKIVDLRKRIRGLLDREDSHLSANVGIQYVWRKRGNPYRDTGKIYGGYVISRVREPDGVKFIKERKPRSKMQFDQYLTYEKSWLNWGSLLASFELPIKGFAENRFCDISVVEVELQGRRTVFSDDKTKERCAANANPIDNTLAKEFDEIFNEVAAVQHPLGRFGSNKREMLLALLADRVQERRELVVEENSEDGKPQTLSHVAYIMAYREFDYLLGEMLNESRFGGDLSTPNATPNPPVAQQEPGEVSSINPLGKHVDEATPVEVLRWVETAAERLIREASK